MAAPQSTIPENAFRIDHTIDGLPAGLAVHACSAVQVNFPRQVCSSMADRGGSTENHICYDPGQAEFPPVTLSFHGNKADIKSAYDTFKKCAEGDSLRGSFTLTIVNPKDGNSDILSITFFDNTLCRYDAIPMVDVTDPTTMTCSVTLQPERIELKAG